MTTDQEIGGSSPFEVVGFFVENIFHEKLNIYDKVIEITIKNTKGDILYNSLKNIGNEFNYNINEVLGND